MGICYRPPTGPALELIVSTSICYMYINVREIKGAVKNEQSRETGNNGYTKRR
jgi:hypothetical protein